MGVVGTEGAIVMGTDGAVRKRIGTDGEEEVIDVEAATAVDPNGTLGADDGHGGIRSVEHRNQSIHEHFIRCVEEGTEPLTSAEDGRKTLLTVMALWESTDTGRAVDVKGS